MTIKYPENRKEIYARMATDAQSELPESEPFIRNNYLSSMLIACAGGIYDQYKTISQLQHQLFVDTATGDFLERYGAYRSIYRLPASKSRGYITFTGSVLSTIPIGTELQSNAGLSYSTLADAQISFVSIAIDTMILSGGIVTATIHAGGTHNFATGNVVDIYGAEQDEYNGSHEIIVTSLSSFTFEISTTPLSPATGNIFASLAMASVEVVSQDFGVATNINSGSSLFLSSIISGVDNTAIVQYEGIAGAEDIESDENLRTRILYAYQHPISYFNVSAITQKCFEINGVTRVFVFETMPEVGAVTVYFMTDNSMSSPIPSASKVNEVKEKLLTIKPAHVMTSDVIVKAPTPKFINFKFSVLDPNTDEMLEAVKNSLKAFFAEEPKVGEHVIKEAYNSAIYYTVDPNSGDFIKDFVLQYPAGDIVVGAGEIAVLGVVTR